jgi:phage shock protein A
MDSDAKDARIATLEAECSANALLVRILSQALGEAQVVLQQAGATIAMALANGELWERAYRTEQARNAAASDSPPPITIPYTRH